MEVAFLCCVDFCSRFADLRRAASHKIDALRNKIVKVGNNIDTVQHKIDLAINNITFAIQHLPGGSLNSYFRFSVF